MFPWLPLGLFGAAAIILVLDTRIKSKILLATVASSGFVAYVFWFAHPSLLNMDPDKVAVAILRTIEFGGTNGISDYVYYSSVPAFHVFVSTLGILSGVSGKEALIVFGIATPVIQILGAAALVNAYYGERARTYAMVIAMVSTAVLYYAVSPIPQLSAVALWMPFVITFDKYIRTRSKAHLVAILVTISTLIYTHKLAMFVVLGTILAAGLIHILKIWFSRDVGIFRPYVTLSILSGFLFTLQNFWLTTFGRTILTDKVGGIFDERVGAPEPVDSSSFLAVHPLPRVPEVIVGNADWIMITALAGICWLVLLRATVRRLYQHTVLLGASMFFGGLMVLSFLAPESAAPRRLLLFATIPFAACIGVVLSDVSSRLQGKKKLVVTTLLAVFLISQLFVTGAVPDHPHEPREYLTPEEVDGKQWTNRYVTGEVHADFFYAREIVDFDRPGQTYVTGSDAVAKGYSSITLPYLNGTVAEEEYQYTLYRPKYDRYQVGGTWVLTWDPESELDGTSNRVFDNGGAVLYENTT